MTTALFGGTLFGAALLLFLVQPLLGKLLLPLVGGAPAVWNTCLVFFQASLLVGYLRAHRCARWGLRTQVAGHLALLFLLAGLLAGCWLLAGSPLPVADSLVPDEQDNPVLPLLALLVLAVGVPFAVLSTTAPLLQRWYAHTRPGRDPYPLYAASNAGSLLGLLAYPFLVEPHLTLSTQRTLWAVAVLVCLGLIALCAVVVGRSTGSVAPAPTAEAPPLERGRVLRWLGLAALPSALLASGTIHLTTDVAPVPLLWVLPLGLYLLSFVIVFAGWPKWCRYLVARLVPMLLVVAVLVLAFGAAEPLELVAGIHLIVLFAVCLLCHGELARDRPEAGHLTAFYLWLAVGGVCGSLFCALLAPLLFARLGLIEYPLGLVLVALIRPGARPDQALLPVRVSDVLAPVLLGGLTAWLIVATPGLLGPLPADDSPAYPQARLLRGGLMYGVPVVLAYALVYRPGRFALALAAVLLAAHFAGDAHGTVQYTSRNFFGTLRVTRSADGTFHRLVHGTTRHGQERIGDDCPPVPLLYYHPTGPAGRVFRSLPAGRLNRVGLVGLGCGALASYGRRGQRWSFYEIDPAVARIARDERWFHYLACCPAGVQVVLGDARRQLAKAEPGSFDLLVLDAFTSDAIPTHLLTREAVQLYFDRLAPDGLLLVHVSNRYLDLVPLLARLAADASPPLVLRHDHNIPSADEAERGKSRSTWVILARHEQALEFLDRDRNWTRRPVPPGPLWTDDFSTLLGVWRGSE